MSAEEHATCILTCKVWAVDDGSGMVIAADAPHRPKGYGVILARISRLGSYDSQRVLADNIAWAINKERGHTE